MMGILILGLAVFIGAHFSLRLSLVQEIKAAKPLLFKGIFSVISLLGFVIIIYGYAQFRPLAADIYHPPLFTRHINYLLTLLAFICLVGAYLGRKIKAVLVHPMLIGVILWAGGHLLANGDLASLILFGSFFIWSLAARFLQPHAVKTPVKWGMGDIIAILIAGLVWFVVYKWLHVMIIGTMP